MSEELKAKIQRIIDEAWNKGNIDALDELYAANFVGHSASPSFPDIEGLKAQKEFVQDTRNTYPDFHITIDEITIEGDTVASRWTWQGTHKGQSARLPVPPTGKQVTVSGCNVGHMQGGKLVEDWNFADLFGMMQQLGVVPEMTPSAS